MDVMKRCSCGNQTDEQPSAPVVHRPKATVGGHFRLTSHSGDIVTERSFPGKHLLVYFGFTNCRTVCPAALGRIDRVLDLLGRTALQIQPLYITVDPERDTPTVMREYLETRHPRVLGLTGTALDIERTMHAYRAFATRREDQEDPDSYLMPHSAFTYLMNEEGEYVAHFTDAVAAQEMANVIAGHLPAADAGTGNGDGGKK